MAGLEPLELLSRKSRQDQRLLEPQLFRDDREEPLGDDEDLAPLLDLEGRVLVIGVKGDGQVRRQGPGRRRPDDDRDRLARERRELRREVRDHREFHINGGRCLVLVLDLRLGQGGLVVGAPVDGTQALVNVPGPEESGQEAEDIGLVARVHGEIGVLPVPQDSEPAELASLDVDELQGVVPAFLADGDRRHLLFPGAERLVHVHLDRQTVAVPAGNVGRKKSHHGARLDDEILEDLVHRRPQVNVPVGIGRTVMEDEHRGARAGCPGSCRRAPSRPIS